LAKTFTSSPCIHKEKKLLNNQAVELCNNSKCPDLKRLLSKKKKFRRPSIGTDDLKSSSDIIYFNNLFLISSSLNSYLEFATRKREGKVK